MKQLLVILFFLTAHLSYTQNKWNWTLSAPVDGMVYGLNGDILIAGSNQNSITLGADSLVPYGCFVASVNRSGDLSWLKKTSPTYGAGWIRSNCICTDEWGNIYLMCRQSGPVISEDSIIIDHPGFTLFKYTSSGKFLWVKKVGSGAGDFSSMKSRNGLIYLAGSFVVLPASPMVMGPYSYTTQPGPVYPGGPWNNDAYLAKLDTAGKVLSLLNFGGTKDDHSTGLALNNAGEIFFSGKFMSQSITIGRFSLSKPTGSGAFLLKMNANDQVVWARSIDGLYGSLQIDADQMGNVCIVGNFQEPDLIVDNFVIAGSGAVSKNGVLIKFDGLGKFSWAKSVVGNGSLKDEACNAVFVDGEDKIYVSGTFRSSSLQLGGYTLYNNTSIPNKKLFVMQLESGGSVTRALDASAGNSDFYLGDILADKEGNIHINGWVSGPPFLFNGTDIAYPGSFVAECGPMFTSLTEKSMNLAARVYPNPANSKFFIEVADKIITGVEIYDVSSNKIKELDCYSERIVVDLRDLESGIYFAVIRTGDQGIVIKKLIKNGF